MTEKTYWSDVKTKTGNLAKTRKFSLEVYENSESHKNYKIEFKVHSFAGSGGSIALRIISVGDYLTEQKLECTLEISPHFAQSRIVKILFSKTNELLYENS